MENTVDIKYEDITLADEHLNGLDYDRCKNALWSIHNVIKKIKNNSPNIPKNGYHNVDSLIRTLGEIAISASYKDESMDSIVYSNPEFTGIVTHETASKKDLILNGFAFTDFVMPDGEKLKKNPNLNKVKQFTLSYVGDDYKDVIFGLKLFAEIGAKYVPRKPEIHNQRIHAGGFFQDADISIAFKNANMKENDKDHSFMLHEKRFDNISDDDKAFITAFDKEMEQFGYDYGGKIDTGHGWGRYQIRYGKTGVKNRPIAARIYIKDSGKIQLRLHLNKVDNHREHIENAPPHIKGSFVFTGGDCKSCGGICAPGKVYTIDGQQMQKCNHDVFYFNNPTLDKLPDYMRLMGKFYKKKLIFTNRHL